jgi:hypothetical protein
LGFHEDHPPKAAGSEHKSECDAAGSRRRRTGRGGTPCEVTRSGVPRRENLRERRLMPDNDDAQPSARVWMIQIKKINEITLEK